MSCGLPIVVSGQSGVSKIVSEGVGGFILNDPCDSARLAELTALPEGNQGLCQGLEEAAAKTAQQQHTWSRSAEQLSQLFQEAPRQRGLRQHTHSGRAGSAMKPARLNPESKVANSGSQEAR